MAADSKKGFISLYATHVVYTPPHIPYVYPRILRGYTTHTLRHAIGMLRTSKRGREGEREGREGGRELYSGYPSGGMEVQGLFKGIMMTKMTQK